MNFDLRGGPSVIATDKSEWISHSKTDGGGNGTFHLASETVITDSGDDNFML
jgi:hypothetical protein